jgi:hypothetical protein
MGEMRHAYKILVGNFEIKTPPDRKRRILEGNTEVIVN